MIYKTLQYVRRNSKQIQFKMNLLGSEDIVMLLLLPRRSNLSKTKVST